MMYLHGFLYRWRPSLALNIDCYGCFLSSSSYPCIDGKARLHSCMVNVWIYPVLGRLDRIHIYLVDVYDCLDMDEVRRYNEGKVVASNKNSKS